jgi:MFS family permease
LSDPAASHATSARAWWALAIFCLLATVSYTDRQILSLLVDPLRKDLLLSDTDVGLLQGVAFAIIYSVAGLPLGRLADAVSRRSLIVGGILIWSTATLACGMAKSFESLFIARFFVGIGEATLAPAAVSMIGDLFEPHRRGRAIAIFLAGMIIGGGVAIAAGGSLYSLAQAGSLTAVPIVGSLTPWRSVLVSLGLLGLPCTALALTVTEPKRSSSQGIDAPRLREVVGYFTGKIRVHGFLLGGLALMSVGDFSMLSWTPALLMRRYGFSAMETGMWLGIIAVAGGLTGVLLGGWTIDRIAARRDRAVLLRAPALAAGLALLGTWIGVAQSGWGGLLAITIWMAASSAAGATGIASMQMIVPERVRGTAIALTSFGNILLGLGIGATATAFLSDHVFAGANSIGLALTAVVLPACVLAIAAFGIAAYFGARTSLDGELELQ